MLLTVVVAVFWLLSAGLVRAQISPGQLSTPHADLEGSDQCLRCHSQKKRVSGELCLECHKVLREQLGQGLGFHATVTDQGCERCHMEHHGRDFELIWWGDDGKPSFDHGEIGYTMQGAHLDLGCRECHKSELIHDPSRFESQGKDLDRTFLGLGRSDCISCHRDPHQGQFSPRPCTDCHGQKTWKLEQAFDHTKTEFLLIGKHQTVACERCHTPSRPGPSSAGSRAELQFKGIAFASCTDCHQDTHQGRLGTRCQQCHSESGWRDVDRQSFDHDKTRFNLEGAHRRTQCSACHPDGSSYRVAQFGTCRDCHADQHLGQFADRDDRGVCTACHSLETFSTPTFGVQNHQIGRYPLEGAHLAVPCNACHRELTPIERSGLASVARAPRRQRIKGVPAKYSFDSTNCVECHRDSHEGAFDRFMATDGCQSCHSLQGWRVIDFDHERTDYSLEGAHTEPGCRQCHEVAPERNLPGELLFDGLGTTCETCHSDPHAGQFADRMGDGYCASCHSVVSWSRVTFDHNRDSSYPLDGRHVGLPCESCHLKEQRVGGLVTVFKPLPKDCVACHADGMIRE